MEDEVDFLPADKHKRSLQFNSITFGVHSQASPSTQNNTFAVSVQYVKESVKDEVDFLPADERQRFLQTDTVILGVCDQACPNHPK